jgi:hypothetical protein
MKKLFATVILLTATMAFAQNDIESKIVRGRMTDENGVPTQITGHLGRLNSANPGESARNVLRTASQEVLQGTGAEDFQPLGVYRDDLGQTHVRMQ